MQENLLYCEIFVNSREIGRVGQRNSKTGRVLNIIGNGRTKNYVIKWKMTQGCVDLDTHIRTHFWATTGNQSSESEEESEEEDQEDNFSGSSEELHNDM